MKLLREITLLLRNTLFVTGAVILGFTLGNALGVPVWLQGFCLLPAALLFNRCLVEMLLPGGRCWPF